MTLNTSFRMEDLAQIYQNILGDNHYSIDVYSNLSIDGNVVQGIMKPYRRPFKLSSVKSETVELVFEFYISVRKRQNKLDELSTLSKICGLKKGAFTSNNKTFTYHSFLDFATPANTPVVDFGDYTQCLVITGTCLVSENTGGLMVSNEITTSLTFNPDTTNEISGQVEVLNISFAESKQTESPVLANSNTAKSFNKAQNTSYTYTILVAKNAVCKRLVKAARKIEPFGLNEIVQVTDNFPAFDDDGAFSQTNNCIVVGCSLIGQAGAFATIDLTLQDAIDLTTGDYEI